MGTFKQENSNGDGIPDFPSPVAYWDYERPTLTRPGDCAAASPANCKHRALTITNSVVRNTQ